jgi:hypothetical protein
VWMAWIVAVENQRRASLRWKINTPGCTATCSLVSGELSSDARGGVTRAAVHPQSAAVLPMAWSMASPE